MTTTVNNEQSSATANTVILEGFVQVKLVSPTGEETLTVPTEIAADDDLLRGLLAQHGVSSAEHARIERAADRTVTLTKQAQQNG